LRGKECDHEMMMNSRTLTTTHCHGTLRLTTSALFPPLHQTHQKKSALKHQPPINTLKGKKKSFLTRTKREKTR
jgi:hypothetical protein